MLRDIFKEMAENRCLKFKASKFSIHPYFELKPHINLTIV